MYLSIVILYFLTEMILTLLNIRYGKKGKQDLPQEVEQKFPADVRKKALAYTEAKGRLHLTELTFSVLLLFALVIFKIPAKVFVFLGNTGLSGFWLGFAFIFSFLIVLDILKTPFSLYSQFIIEEKFGFNTMTAKLYFADKIKALLVGMVIGIPLLVAVFWFIEASGAYWWVWVFGALALFQIVFYFLYPLVIAPLFNKFTPLEEGSLKNRLADLAKVCEFPFGEIFTMDGSKRSKHGNAYFTGFGKAKRIVLFDTLIDSMEEEEIAGVLAHEIGHQKLGHLTKRLIVSSIFTFLMLFLAGKLYPMEEFWLSMGFSGASSAGFILFLSLYLEPVMYFLSPLFSSFSRRHEYQADAYSREKMSSGAPLKIALLKLTKDNLSNLIPHPLYSWFHYSHPTLIERMSALDEKS